jgi:hypothetical protein
VARAQAKTFTYRGRRYQRWFKPDGSSVDPYEQLAVRNLLRRDTIERLAWLDEHPPSPADTELGPEDEEYYDSDGFGDDVSTWMTLEAYRGKWAEELALEEGV